MKRSTGFLYKLILITYLYHNNKLYSIFFIDIFYFIFHSMSMDVHGSMQRRVFAERKLVVEQCTRMYIQKRHGCRWFHAEASFSIEKLVVEKCTRMYTFQQRYGIEAVSFLVLR